jgi:hypothetical protein
MRRMVSRFTLKSAARFVGFASAFSAAAIAAAEVQLTVTEPGVASPLPCRVHLKDATGKAILPEGFPCFRTHFVCPGEARLNLPAGDYTVAIERGHEYTAADATWRVNDSGAQSFRYELKRITDLGREGWWGGDIHVHRPLADIELLMRADDLHIAPVITWWNNKNLWATPPPPASLLVRFDGNRFYQLMAGEDERGGGALLYFGLETPLAITNQDQEYRSPMVFLLEAKQRGAWVDVEKPFWYDVPVWLASGKVDSIGIANNHMLRHMVIETEAWGRARDVKRYPAPHGNGLWTQDIYYHILNTGLRIPPSAGSASGVIHNPVGYNRVYVHLDGELGYEAWWAGLRAGRSFVSNGPLLRVKASGHWPGHVFRASAGKDVDVAFDVQLDGRDSIDRIEIIRNGAIAKTVTSTEWLRTRSLGTMRVNESGWFLVRVIADVADTFRFASTAPFYVEIGNGPPRISRTSAQFFLDWVRERAAKINLPDAQHQAEVLEFHTAAEAFWRQKLAAANAP